MSISRRSFLTGAAGVAVAPLLPALPAAAAPATDVAVVTAPLQKMWAVGTPGEFDWQAVAADTAEEAYQFFCEEHDYDPDDFGGIDECVQRVPRWDGKKARELTGEDWFKASFGYNCSECSYEAFPETGARCVEGQVYCEDCMTMRLRIIDDPDDVVELLANDIAFEGEAEVRERLVNRKEWDDVPADLWIRACAMAVAP